MRVKITFQENIIWAEKSNAYPKISAVLQENIYDVIKRAIDKISEEKINCWKMKGTSLSVKSLDAVKKLKLNYERMYSIQEFLNKMPTLQISDELLKNGSE